MVWWAKTNQETQATHHPLATIHQPVMLPINMAWDLLVLMANRSVGSWELGVGSWELT